MTVHSISFDDDSDEDLYVFSGNDLLISHYDQVDLDWQEVAERTAIDERRGLVILQVATLEDVVDEFLLYLGDEEDQAAQQRRLEAATIGPRLRELEGLLRGADLLDDRAEQLLVTLRSVVDRRNELAHGTISPRLVSVSSVPPGRGHGLAVEWVLVDRRSRTIRRITMRELRQDLYDALGAVSEMVSYAEHFVSIAPWPVHFRGGAYLATPTA